MKRKFTAVHLLFRSALFCSAIVLLAAAPARADVGVVLNEALSSGGDKISSTGHSAVYFSRICPETPVKLRFCHEGEHGSILSNYTGFGETEPFEWNIAPLGVFLYGAEDPRQWPLVGSSKIKHTLEERYRARYLSHFCNEAPCTTSDKADWRYMAGSGLDRNMYIFVVETTVEQDREMIEQFNAMPNENHFNAITRNCANFTKSVINTYFPGATRKEYLNDFGMTSPKAVARSFTNYAKKHPELKLRIMHFAQLPGDLKRSKEVRDGTEQLYHSGLFALPLAALSLYALPAAVVSYSVTGRFNPEHEWEQRSSKEEAQLAADIQTAKKNKDSEEVERLKVEERKERDRLFGTDEDWEGYKNELNNLLDEAVKEGILPDKKSADDILSMLDKSSGTPYVDARGSLWIQIEDGEHSGRVGLTPSNILAAGSDARLAYRLLLARTDRLLKSPKHGRETLPAFRKDWALMEAARKRCGIASANAKPNVSDNDQDGAEEEALNDLTGGNE
jgi:hypothetical protein